MKRDRERIRRILVRLESEPTGIIVCGGLLSPDPDELADEYHLKLMSDEGMVLEINYGTWRLTSLGHDAVEAINDPEVWDKLKEAAPKEAYEIIKGVGSSLAVAALSKLMGWG